MPLARLHCPSCRTVIEAPAGDPTETGPDQRVVRCADRTCYWAGQVWECRRHSRISHDSLGVKRCARCELRKLRYLNLAPSPSRLATIAICPGCGWWAQVSE